MHIILLVELISKPNFHTLISSILYIKKILNLFQMPSKLNISHHNHNRMIEGLTWSSPSASPSPPPPPLPPPVAARWIRTEQASSESCPHCRGRLASLPTRTTSLSSYSCKGNLQFILYFLVSFYE